MAALNRKIELWEPAISRNESGQKVQDFISKGLISCDLNNKKGIEKYQSFLTVSENRILFLIRYNPDIKPTWVIVHNGTKYEILNIIEEVRLQFMYVIGQYRDNEQSY